MVRLVINSKLTNVRKAPVVGNKMSINKKVERENGDKHRFSLSIQRNGNKCRMEIKY
jgi:hypothetical protein